jgi:hypothetical protein
LWYVKSPPTVEVSEFPLVPTNDAPNWMSQAGGGFWAAALSAPARTTSALNTYVPARRKNLILRTALLWGANP